MFVFSLSFQANIKIMLDERPQPLLPNAIFTIFLFDSAIGVIHLHHKHQGLNPLIRSISRVTAAVANVS
jgi:hypothetical protein